MPALTKALVDAGALGTIQSATPTTTTPSATMAGQSWPPISILDGYASSWDKLPVLPDIKLLNTQYDEIKALAEKNDPVELEFDIRNWFKMGPIKYHNVVATIKGSTYPDEYIVMGGHFDCFSGATGGIDDGSGFAPGMEAMRLIKMSGAKPKRSIVMILFAAEEQGLVGSQAWLKKHPEIAPKVVMMINRDSTPMAIVGAAVPETWYSDFQKITAPAERPLREVAVQAGEVAAARARDQPRRHRFLVVRDAVGSDAPVPDADRLRLPVRVAHDRTTSTASWCPTPSSSSSRRR